MERIFSIYSSYLVYQVIQNSKLNTIVISRFKFYKRYLKEINIKTNKCLYFKKKVPTVRQNEDYVVDNNNKEQFLLYDEVFNLFKLCF